MLLRRLAAGWAAMVVALLAVWIMAAPARADVPKADLGVSASGANGDVGESVEIRYVLRNAGPGMAAPGTWSLDVTIPDGTQFGGGNLEQLGQCSSVSRTHVRCTYAYPLLRGDRRELRFGLRIVSAPQTCGAMIINYPNDPRPGNNGVNLRVSVDGKPRSCSAAARSASPTPRTSRSPSPSPTPEATETVVEETGASASDSPSPLPLAAGNTDGGGLGLGSILVLGGGALLVGVGGVIMWRLLRKDPEDDLEDETQTFSRQYPRHSR